MHGQKNDLGPSPDIVSVQTKEYLWEGEGVVTEIVIASKILIGNFNRWDSFGYIDVH
jgi:hypothetical protein